MLPGSQTPPAPLVEPLTPREAGILARLADGKSNREIAEIETLALSSVKWYIQQIYTKLGVNSRSEAVARAGELGLLKTETTGPLPPAKHNLPRQLTRFIGREKETGQVVALVRAAALVTLTGTGGVGKTRLSLAVAEKLLGDFPDGAWFVELAVLSDPALVLPAVAGVLGVQETPGRVINASVADFLRAKRLLLILDNCEHLVAAVARLADELLRACPALHVLATSRELLGVGGEVAFRVPSLSIPDAAGLPPIETLNQYDAIRLFLERAQTASAGFTLAKDNAEDVVKICQRLDGIPLAIELAAARLRVLSASQIALRLDDVFRLLTGGSRTALPHHQTLRALIDWSYYQLSPAEQSLLCQLAMFSGGWTLEAAEALCNGNDTLDLLSSLVDKSLVLVSHGQDNERRYHMLETVRQYARERLWEKGSVDTLRRQHLDYFLRLAEASETDLRGRNQKATLDRLEAELGNLRAALEWSFEENNIAELRLAGALKWLWHIRGHRTEGLHWLEEGLSVETQSRGSSPLAPDHIELRAKALGAAGCLRTMQREMDKAAVWLGESLELYRQLGTQGKNGAAFALNWLGLGAFFKDDNTRAIALAQESLALYRETGDEFGQGECLKLIGDSLSGTEPDRAKVILEENLALQKKIGDPDGTATAYYSLGRLAVRQNDMERSAELLAFSQDYYRKVGNRDLVAELDFHLGNLALSKGENRQSFHYFEEAYAYYKDIETYDAYNIIFDIMMRMARIAWSQGDILQALRLYQETYPISQKTDNEILTLVAQLLSCFPALSQRDWAQVYAHIQNGYRLCLLPGNENTKFFMLECLGAVAMGQHQPIKAARLYGAAQKSHHLLMQSLTLTEGAFFENNLASVHAALGDDAFEAALAEGRASDSDQTLRDELNIKTGD